MTNKGSHFYGYERTVCVGIAAIATAGSTDESAVFIAPFRCRIKKCDIVVNTAITGQNTHYQTLGMKNKGAAGTGTDVIASKAFTSGVNATAFDKTTLGDISNGQLNEGDTVTFYKAVTGNGQAMPDLLAVITYVRRG